MSTSSNNNRSKSVISRPHWVVLARSLPQALLVSIAIASIGLILLGSSYRPEPDLSQGSGVMAAPAPVSPSTSYNYRICIWIVSILVLLFLTLIPLLWVFSLWKGDSVEFRNGRLYRSKDPFGRHIVARNYNFADWHYRQSWLGKLMNYGDLVIGSGENAEHIPCRGHFSKLRSFLENGKTSSPVHRTQIQRQGCGCLTLIVLVPLVVGTFALYILSNPSYSDTAPDPTPVIPTSPSDSADQLVIVDWNPVTSTIITEEQIEQRLHKAWAEEDWEEVINLTEQLLTFNPDDTNMTEKLYAAHVNYGYALIAEGRFEEAKAEFNYALGVKPDGGEALEGLQALASEMLTPTPTPQLQYTIHVVQQGENLYRIALRYDATVKDIMATNGLADHCIYVGQELNIPIN
jgi:tetratricopeptide (TPR) repeat protein